MAALPFAASIDNLVEHYRDDQQVVTLAKWAIARVISSEEAKSYIGQTPTPHPDAPKGLEYAHWEPETSYHALFRLIVQGVPRHDLARAFERVNVLTFNYDRTIEAFFVRALRLYSDIPTEEAIDIANNANIIHAYGSLDPLKKLQYAGTYFNDIHHHDQIPILSEGLRTFSESVDSDADAPLRAMVNQAQSLVFLGCAYHRQNLDLIRPHRLNAHAAYGTVYVPAPTDPWSNAAPPLSEFSEPTRASVVSNLVNWSATNTLTLSHKRCHFRPMTCRQLIAHHGVDWCE